MEGTAYTYWRALNNNPHSEGLVANANLGVGTAVMTWKQPVACRSFWGWGWGWDGDRNRYKVYAGPRPA